MQRFFADVRSPYVSQPPLRGLSLDHPIRSRQHIRRNCQANCFRRLQIDNELELLRLLHREIGGLSAFQDFVHISGSTPVQVDIVHAVTHTPAVFHKFAGSMSQAADSLALGLQSVYGDHQGLPDTSAMSASARALVAARNAVSISLGSSMSRY